MMGSSAGGGDYMKQHGVDTSGDSLRQLQCLECGQVADVHAHGWRGYLGGGYEGEPLEVGIYCPACAAREFDGQDELDTGRRRRR